MSLRKNGIGYYVEGRNGLPGRSFPKLSEAQRYDQEIERAACAPPKTTTQLLAELYSDLVRWRDAGGDVRELRYVFETMDQISAEKALRLTLDDPRALASLTAKLTTPEAATSYRAIGRLLRASGVLPALPVRPRPPRSADISDQFAYLGKLEDYASAMEQALKGETA